MNSTRNTTHVIRNEQGQFAATLSGPQTTLNQIAVNSVPSHWQWLNEHGFAKVEPSEIFASPRGHVNWNSK